MAFSYNVASAGNQHSWVKGNAARHEEFFHIGRSLVVFHKPAAVGFEQGIVGYTEDINATNDYYGLFFDGANKPKFRVKNGSAVTTAATGNAVSAAAWSLSIITMTAGQIVVTLNDDTAQQGVFNGTVPVVLDPRYLYFGLAQTPDKEVGGVFGRGELAVFIYDKILSAGEQSAIYNGGSFTSPLNVAFADVVYGWDGYDDNLSFRGIHPVVQRNGAPGPSETGHPYTVYPTPVRTVESFGAVGDGVTDDAAALNSAFADVNSNGGTLEFGTAKTYRSSQHMTHITRRSGGLWYIRGNGATIKATDGKPVSAGNQMFFMDRAELFIVRDFNIDGNRNNRGAPSQTTNFDWQITDGKDGVIRNCRVIESVNDGIYFKANPTPITLDKYCENIFIGGSSFDRNARNGVAVIEGTNLKFWYNIFEDTGGAGSVLPRSGLDFEPNTDSEQATGSTGNEVYWNELRNNDRWGLKLITFAGPVSDTIIRFNKFLLNDLEQGSSSGGHMEDEALRTICEDNYFTTINSAFRGVIDLPSGGTTGNAEYRRNRFADKNFTTSRQGTQSWIYVHAGHSGGNIFEDQEYFDYPASNATIAGDGTKFTETGAVTQPATPDPGDNRPMISDPNEPLEGGITVPIGPSAAAFTGPVPGANISGNLGISVNPNALFLSGLTPTLAEGNIPIGISPILALGFAPLLRSTLAQNAAPTTDLINGGWRTHIGGANLFSQIDEQTPNDSDFIHSGKSPAGDICELRLDALVDPGVDNKTYVIAYRYGKIGGETIDITIELREGVSKIIASWLHQNVDELWQTTQQVLSPAEVAQITDHADLRLRFIANKP